MRPARRIQGQANADGNTAPVRNKRRPAMSGKRPGDANAVTWIPVEKSVGRFASRDYDENGRKRKR